MKKWKISSTEELVEIISYPLDYVLDNEWGWDDYYKLKIEIPKKNGKREIYSVNKDNSLYLVQNNFKRYFLDNIMISDRAFGFVKKENYFSFLMEHINTSGNNNYLRIDIKDFFGSIKERHIAKTFDSYTEGEEKEKIIEAIKNIVLYNGYLVQGTPVAPVVSNIVFRPLDIRIEKYCNKQKITYTRYADDLLFSSENETVLSHRFIRTIERILESDGFSINYNKLRRTKKALSINGFVVDKSVRLSRKKLSSVNAMIFYLENHKYKEQAEWIRDFNLEVVKHGYEVFGNNNEIAFYLAGYRAFLIEAKKASDHKGFTERCDRLIHRMENQIEQLSKSCPTVV